MTDRSFELLVSVINCVLSHYSGLLFFHSLVYDWLFQRKSWLPFRFNNAPFRCACCWKATVFLRIITSFLTGYWWLAKKIFYLIIVFRTVISKHFSARNFNIYRISIIFLINPVLKLIYLILQGGLDIWKVPSPVLVTSLFTLTLKLTHVFFAKVGKNLVEFCFHRDDLIVFIIRLLCWIFLFKLNLTSFFAKDEAV